MGNFTVMNYLQQMKTQADKVCRIVKKTFQKYGIFLLILVFEGAKPSAT
jgi:hypothetical protein